LIDCLNAQPSELRPDIPATDREHKPVTTQSGGSSVRRTTYAAE
jgi:hypothetical protein